MRGGLLIGYAAFLILEIIRIKPVISESFKQRNYNSLFFYNGNFYRVYFLCIKDNLKVLDYNIIIQIIIKKFSCISTRYFGFCMRQLRVDISLSVYSGQQ